jgi:hypothetical protein
MARVFTPAERRRCNAAGDERRHSKATLSFVSPRVLWPIRTVYAASASRGHHLSPPRWSCHAGRSIAVAGFTLKSGVPDPRERRSGSTASKSPTTQRSYVADRAASLHHSTRAGLRVQRTTPSDFISERARLRAGLETGCLSPCLRVLRGSSTREAAVPLTSRTPDRLPTTRCARQKLLRTAHAVLSGCPARFTS